MNRDGEVVYVRRRNFFDFCLNFFIFHLHNDEKPQEQKVRNLHNLFDLSRFEGCNLHGVLDS